MPEAVLFKHIPLLSNHFYKDDKCPSVKLVEVRMWVQMAEMYMCYYVDSKCLGGSPQP